MIKRSPLATDPPGKCTRWHVVIYNRKKKTKDWHTVIGTKEDAKKLERDFEGAKKRRRAAVATKQITFEELGKLCIDDKKANSRRASTIEEYETELRIRLLPQASDNVPPLGPRDIRSITRADMKAHFNALRTSGSTVSEVNKAIKIAKSFFTYAFDAELVESNVLSRYKSLQKVEGERTVNRGVFTEDEVRAIFSVATLFELALFGTLAISGPRPGEIYALEWNQVYLDAEKPYVRIVRSWCQKGRRFYPPKTAAGKRTVPISAWLAAVLKEHRQQSGGVGLVFPNAAGKPLDRQNVRKRVWIPLLERAKVRYRDIYSLRWTFVSLARASGELAFNVARMIGHARSSIVDLIYAHTVDTGIAGISESVAARTGLTTPKPTPPEPPPVGNQAQGVDQRPRLRPTLRVIAGGGGLRPRADEKSEEALQRPNFCGTVEKR